MGDHLSKENVLIRSNSRRNMNISEIRIFALFVVFISFALASSQAPVSAYEDLLESQQTSSSDDLNFDNIDEDPFLLRPQKRQRLIPFPRTGKRSLDQIPDKRQALIPFPRTGKRSLENPIVSNNIPEKRHGLILFPRTGKRSSETGFASPEKRQGLILFPRTGKRSSENVFSSPENVF